MFDGDVFNDDLILTKFDGSKINAGNVRGSTGAPGPEDATALRDRLATNVKDPQWGPGVLYTHGAIADGASHPLTFYFATIAAAKEVYPHANALTDELDWASSQKAMNYLTMGGGVYHPKGTYRFNRQDHPQNYYLV